MKKVYVVDDDRDIVESVTMVLESEGYEVKSQMDEENIVENVKGYGPNLIILDVMFPQNDSAGFEMARLLHDCGETKDIPILMLSAINEKGVYAGTFSSRDKDETFLPVSEFVEKPLSAPDLLAKVAELIKD